MRVAKLIAVAVLLLSAHSASAGQLSLIAYQTPGDYTPRPDIAAEIGTFLIGQFIPVPTPLGGMFDRAARLYGTEGAPYRELPAPIMPGKISAGRE